MKKLIALLLTIMLICSAVSSVAEGTEKPVFDPNYVENMSQRVFDNAGILPDYTDLTGADDRREFLDLFIYGNQLMGKIDSALLIIDDFIGYGTHTALAQAFYEQMDMGMDEEKSGILVLVDTYQQCHYVYLAGKCRQCSPEAWQEEALKDAVDSSLNDGAALINAFTKVTSFYVSLCLDNSAE